MSLLWIFAFLIGQRLLELYISKRNRRIAYCSGGREFYRESFAGMAALHSGFLIALLYESFPWQIKIDIRTVACLFVLIILQCIRYWCIATLGNQWNTRIILVPGSSMKKSGPYRYVRHPNYLVVILEFIFIPVLMHAPLTLVLFSGLNLIVVCKRIRLEEAALRSFTDYNTCFPVQSDRLHRTHLE